MSQAQYAARWLGPNDARITYPLMRLRVPSLTYKEWGESLKSGHAKRAGVWMIGIFNASGCVIAVLRTAGIDVELVAGPPALLASRETLIETARDFVRALENA